MASTTRVRGRLLPSKGADVASASALVLGYRGNMFDVTGTTTVNHINTINWKSGSRILLQFDGALTVTHNAGSVPANCAAIKLQGAGDLTTAAGDRLELTYDGTDWIETGRAIVAGIGATDIAAGAVGSSELATNAVTTAKITAANVTMAKIENGTGLSVIGRSANSAGVNADIVGTDGGVLRVSGTTLGFGTIVAAGIASNAVETAKILDGNVTAAKIASASLVGTQAAVLADAAVIGGIPVCHTIAIANGSSADTDVVLTHKTEILDVVVQKRGGAGGANDTITIKNSADAITDAIDINDADKTISRPTTIDDAYSTIAAGGTLRVAMVNGGAGGNNTACLVHVIGVRRT